MKESRVGITWILAILIIMSTFLQPVHAVASFTDKIPVWAIDSVDDLVEKGVIMDKRFLKD